MAAPLKTQTEVSRAMDGHSNFLYAKDNAAQNAFDYLKDYNFELTGVMPNHSWQCPDGFTFEFNASGSALLFAGSDYTSLAPARKVVFWRWLNHFIRECLKNYDDTYGL